MTAKTHPLTFIDTVCGKPWIHVIRVMKPTDPVLTQNFEHLDGRPSVASDLIRCDSCGRMGDSVDLLAMTDPKNYRPRWS